MDGDRLGQTWMDQDEPGWTDLDRPEPTCTDPDEPRLTQTDLDGLEIMYFAVLSNVEVLDYQLAALRSEFIRPS